MSTQLRQQGPSAERLTREAFAAIGPRTHAVPYSVHEADVRREQFESEARVIGEISHAVIHSAPDPECLHPNLCALNAAGSSLDDHATHYGYCPECKDFFVVTEYSTGGVESRAMTEAEQKRFATVEDRTRFSEWIEDFQAGAE